jgi:hypothetical protein
MFKKTMYQKIRDLKKQGYGKYEISIKLGIDPSTARKYFHMEPAEYSTYRDALQERNKLYEGYEQEILELYEKNNNRCLNMAAVYDYLEERHEKLAGNEKTLRNYIHSLLASGKLIYSQNIRCYDKVPELPYGKQMQLDFGVHQNDGGFKIHILGAVLSASRYKYVGLQGVSFTTEDLILHLLDCFDNFGGLPEELVIDQDSIMVVNENYGDIVYTQKFSAFLEEMNLKMYVCRKSDPETKGKIENVIKYVKYNFLNVRNFQTMEEARESLARWLKRRGNGKISQATKRVPLIAIEEERGYLKPLRNSIFRKTALLGREVRTVSEKGFIMVGSNEYSVPVSYRNRAVEMYKTESEVFVFDKNTGKEIACHKIDLITGRKAINKKHFREKSSSINDLRQIVLTLYDFDIWKEFIEANMKNFPRYVRDQFLFAQKHLSRVEDSGILEMAVDYCLKNRTFAMTELLDTYRHCLQEKEEEQKMIQTAFRSVLKNATKPCVRVPQRPVTHYEQLVGIKKERPV